MTVDVGFEPVPEAGPAGWLTGQVRGPEPGAREFRVRDLVPVGFQAYARVFHPTRDGAGRPVRWSEVARRTGRGGWWRTWTGCGRTWAKHGRAWRRCWRLGSWRRGRRGRSTAWTRRRTP